MDMQKKSDSPYDGAYQPHIITSPPQITVVQPVIMVDQRTPMGTRSQSMVCKNCDHTVNTELRFRPTTKTHLFALGLCLICFWPCVCVPYCINSCHNVDHYCPHCEHYIGSYLA